MLEWRIPYTLFILYIYLLCGIYHIHTGVFPDFFSTRYATFTAFHEKRSMALHSVTWKNLWSVRRGCAFHVDYIPEWLLIPNRQVWRQALWYFFPMYIPIINNPYTLHTRYVFYCENTLLIDSKVWLKNESHIFF